jgi:peptide/nickel transport system substrate-binding protein
MDRTKSKTFTCNDYGKFFGGAPFEVTVVDDLTVDFKSQRPEPILPMRLAGTPIVGPNESLTTRSLAPVGTGPYAFDSWTPGSQILLKRFDKYWGPKPEVEGARYVWRKESAVRAAMVKLGEADIAPSIALQDADDPKLDKPYLNSETSFLRIDVTQKPLDDKRVRLALNYAVDLDGIRKSMLTPAFVRAAQMVMPAIPGHDFDLDKRMRGYDPAKAKQLLAEAKADGVDVDKEILLQGRPSSYPEAAEILEATYTMYRQVGFNMKLVQLEPGLYAKWNNKPFPDPREPSLLQSQHDNAFGDPVFSFPYRYMCGDNNNSTLCDPELDKEIVRVGTLSGDERVAGWQKLSRRMYDDYVNEVFFFHMVANARINPRVQWTPDVSTNSEVRIENIGFTKK